MNNPVNPVYGLASDKKWLDSILYSFQPAMKIVEPPVSQ